MVASVPEPEPLRTVGGGGHGVMGGASRDDGRLVAAVVSLLHGAEALRPAVGGECGVELVGQASALVQAARKHGDDLDQVLGEVVHLRAHLYIEVVDVLVIEEEGVDKALQLAVLVGVWYVGRLFHAPYSSRSLPL